MYVAIRSDSSAGPLFVARASLPVMNLSNTLNNLFKRTALAALFIILGSTLISYFISREIRKPVETLIKGAKQFGEGNLAHRIYISDPEEFTLLGNAMNRMAAEMSGRLATITEQRNELESILSSMNEAVLVVDTKENILRFNHAAANYFMLDGTNAVGRPIQEVICNFDLLKFIRKTLLSQHPQMSELVIHDAKEHFLQAHGTLLLDSENRQMGVVVVLADVTNIRRLEGVRKEFVANVSHELKTPITAIKGSVETLRDGAAEEPEVAKRFLDIILKHADRLNTIVEDLLNLSRIEKEHEDASIVRSRENVKSIVDEAVLLCRKAASEKQMDIEVSVPDHLTLYCNSNMVQQAVINLIDNAVKYSDTGSAIHIEAAKKTDRTIIAVKDQGQGIAQDHLPRLFERFYRVDTSRSRDMGGTGLGLSIVKHIMQSHQGQVTVESKVGEGSTFTLTFP
jgi:two-component system phosphate regulon sensor histidine kinase PhoR